MKPTRPKLQGAPRSRGVEGVIDGADHISLGRRLEVKDRTHLEIKLDYGFPTRSSKTLYDMEIYFFFPGSLEVNRETYPHRSIYNDIRTYLRFRTPDLRLEELANKAVPDSPLFKLMRYCHEAEVGKIREEDIIEEAKLYGCLTRSYLSTSYRKLIAKTDPRMRKPKRTRVEPGKNARKAQIFHRSAYRLLAAFREIRSYYQDIEPPLPSRVLAALEDVDQFLSYEYERRFAQLLKRLQRFDPEAATTAQAEILSGLNAERNHRFIHGLKPGVAESPDRERYLYRVGILKKFVSSVLYLNWDRSVPEQQWSFWVGSLAAGLAMGMTALATHALGVTPAFNTSMVVAVILIYILKDRTKEMVKQSLSSENTLWIPDMDTEIRARRSDQVIGRCQETSRWVKQGDLPPEVERLRCYEAATHKDLRKATGETVLWYRKRISLYSGRLQEIHNRREGVNDILRIRVRRFMFHMDSSLNELHGLSSEGDEVFTLGVWKTYSIDMVMRYSAEGHAPRYEKFRMTLDRKGIRRVQLVMPPTEVGELPWMNARDEQVWDREED